MQYCFCTLLLFLAGISLADSTVTVGFDSLQSSVPWKFSLKDTTIVVDPQAALHGPLGLCINNPGITGRYPSSFLNCRTRFQPESWLRFYFRLASWHAPGQGKQSLDFIQLFTVNFSDRIQREQPLHFLVISIAQSSAAAGKSFSCRLRPSAAKEKEEDFAAPLELGKTYCAEIHFRFFHAESVECETFLNGDTVFSVHSLFPFSRDFIQVQTGNSCSPGLEFELHMDDVAISPGRLFAIPPKPVNCITSREDNTIRMGCDPFFSPYQDERQHAVRWRLAARAMPEFPLFDAIETDPAFFNRRRIPFPLDTGLYYWQVAFQNNFDNWGDFSQMQEIRMDRLRQLPINIDEAFFSSADPSRSLQSLVPGEWYSLNLRVVPRKGWANISYFLVQLNHPDYSFGHVANKGGRFSAASNYVLNLSLSTRENHKMLYEKPRENSMDTRRLDQNVTGLYLDGRQDSIIIDTLKGLVRIRFRVLEKALAGTWLLTASVYDNQLNISNIYRKKFQVNPKTVALRGQKGKILLAVVILVLAVILIAGVQALRRRRQRPFTLRTDDPEFRRLLEYLKSHLKEEIIVTKVRSELGFSDHGFRILLKRNNIRSLPKLLNRLRIEKAKQMLLDPRKNISEIGFEVGFTEARYFSKVFKDYVELTPSEYREKFKK
jgi:AraC-like DNA-binding protein